jgi:hypothetical protein
VLWFLNNTLFLPVAISYQYAKLTLNFSSIFTQFEHYEAALEVLKTNLSAPITINIKDKDQASFVSNQVITIGSIIKDVRRMNLEAITLHQEEAANMVDLIKTLRNI